MSNLTDKNREKAEIKILQSVTIKCKDCGGTMVRVHDWFEEIPIGYSCESCPHYVLFSRS